jgi:MFS family permease
MSDHSSLQRDPTSPIIAAYWHPIVLVFLPFAAGYFLSYFFRTINAVIAGQLTTELGLDASHLGLMTSVYFLTFAAIQVPQGYYEDEPGRRPRGQAACGEGRSGFRPIIPLIPCDIGHRNNRCQGVKPFIRNKEGIMSLLYHTSKNIDLKRPDYGFVLALICMALAVVVGAVVFAPAPVGSGINFSELTSVGP